MAKIILFRLAYTLLLLAAKSIESNGRDHNFSGRLIGTKSTDI